jgi:hypothetical protein
VPRGVHPPGQQGQFGGAADEPFVDTHHLVSHRPRWPPEPSSAVVGRAHAAPGTHFSATVKQNLLPFPWVGLDRPV